MRVEDFSAVMVAGPEETAMFAIIRILRQVAPHQKGIQLFPAGLLVIPFAAADDGKAGAFIEPSCRRVVFLDFQKYRCARRALRDGRDGVSSRLREKPRPRWLSSTAIDNISASSAAMRDTAKPITLRPSLSAMHQRVALAQHGLEFAFAPAAVK